MLYVKCLLFWILLLIWAGIGQAQWSEPAIDGSLRSAPLDPPPVTGSTFYVDGASIGGTCNNSNSGTITSPWCTIGKAMTTLTAGQRAYIRAHTYNEGNLHPTNSGTAGNYITFERYPSDAQPVLNCSGNIFCFDGAGFNWSYLVINGLDIHSPVQQIYVQDSVNDHHIWFVNNKIHNSATGGNRDFAGFVIGGNFNVFSNNEAYDHPVHFVGANGHDNIFEFNVVHDNGWNGDDEGAIKCGASAVYNCVIRYNIAYDNFRDPAIATTACFGGATCQGITGFYIDLGVDNNHAGAMTYFYNNISFDNDIGLQVYETLGARVFNNITYHNGFTPGFAAGFVANFGHGITVEATSTQNVQVYNNTSYNNRNRGINYGGAPNGTVISRNNISMNNGTDFASFNISNGNYNYDLMFNNSGGVLINWGGTTYTSLSTFLARGGNTTWLNALNSNPLFVNAATANFQLQSSSPARDSGQTQTLMVYDYANVTRPQGSAWDIGAYEFVVTSTPPTATITAPTSGSTYSASATPLTTLAGSATDDVGVTSVTWACPTCTPTSGTATCGSCGASATSVTWSVASIGLTIGDNVITVTANDGDTQTGADQLTVTYNPISSSATPFRLIR